MTGRPFSLAAPAAPQPLERTAQELTDLAKELAADRARRRLERQDARARQSTAERRRLADSPAVDSAFYANVGRYSGQVILSVFEHLGGVEAMTDWAEDNPTDFYTKLFPKIVTSPRQVEVNGTMRIEEAIKTLDLEEGTGYTVVAPEPAQIMRPEDF